MNRILPCLLLSVGLMQPVPLQAVEIDAAIDLHLRCGAGYLLVADDPEMNNTADEAETLREMGRTLLGHADSVLSGLGASEAERQQIGMRYAAEVDAALTRDTDLGFDPDDCAPLLATVQAHDLETEIDKYMTCGTAFLVAAGISQQAGDAETAADLEALGDQLVGRGDDLMVEAELAETARYQIGQMYAESISAKINAGEELDYDWDSCAALGV